MRFERGGNPPRSGQQRNCDFNCDYGFIFDNLSDLQAIQIMILAVQLVCKLKLFDVDHCWSRQGRDVAEKDGEAFKMDLVEEVRKPLSAHHAEKFHLCHIFIICRTLLSNSPATFLPIELYPICILALFDHHFGSVFLKKLSF